jgi:hypothetical protein
VGHRHELDVDNGDTVHVDPKTPAIEKSAEVIKILSGFQQAHRLLESNAKAVNSKTS